jgi:hypothetical protein
METLVYVLIRVQEILKTKFVMKVIMIPKTVLKVIEFISIIVILSMFTLF